jgi:hypothetical protein
MRLAHFPFRVNGAVPGASKSFRNTRRSNLSWLQMHTALKVISLAAGTALFVIGMIRIRGKRKGADKLEGEEPDGRAAARLRHELFSRQAEMYPAGDPRLASLEFAFNPRAREIFKHTRPGRVEAARQAVAIQELADRRESKLRRSLAGDLRGDLRWDVVTALLGLVIVVVSAVDALAGS